MTGLFRSIVRAVFGDVTRVHTFECWGDSLTEGAGGTPYPAQLATLTGCTVNNRGVGGETSTQIATRMLAGAAQRQNVAIIWAGRNNYPNTATVIADVAAMVASLGHERFLVLSVLNGEYGNEYAGQSGYTQIATINAALSAAYGARYVNVRAALVAAYNAGLPQDVTDHGRDIVPSSLRSDNIHLNTAGYAIAAAQVLAALPSAVTGGPLVSVGLLRELFNSPPGLGTVTPGPVRATSVTASELSGTAGVTIAGKRIYLAGDNVSLHVPARWIPVANDAYDVGDNLYRWRHGYFSGTIQANALQVTVNGSFASVTIGGKLIYLSGDSTALQASATFAPDGHGTRDVGYSAALAWRNGYFSGTVQAEEIAVANGVKWRSGEGSPEGVVTAVVGSLYSRTDGGAGTSLYVKQSGSGNTGWVAK